MYAAGHLQVAKQHWSGVIEKLEVLNEMIKCGKYKILTRNGRNQNTCATKRSSVKVEMIVCDKKDGWS